MLIALFITGILMYIIGSRLDKGERRKREREIDLKYGHTADGRPLERRR